MESGGQLINAAIEFLKAGFESVNGVKGLLLALLGAYFLTEWKRIFAVALGAMAAHIVLDTLVNLGWSGAFVLPPFADVAYGEYLLKVYAGYLIVIAVFYLVKSLLKGSAG